jgi:hypothetical protein
MEFWGKRVGAALATALVCGLAVSIAAPAAAQKKGKSTQTEAVWVAFDEGAKTVTVKVKKPGRGKNAKRLKKGKEATFKVKPTGSVLTRTTVAINGVKGEIADIPAGKSVNVYWVPEGDDVLFARKIDVVLSEEEINARSEVE